VHNLLGVVYGWTGKKSMSKATSWGQKRRGWKSEKKEEEDVVVTFARFGSSPPFVASSTEHSESSRHILSLKQLLKPTSASFS